MNSKEIDTVEHDRLEILEYLQKKQYELNEIPDNLHVSCQEGESLVLAYPIQGLLKYHGMSNSTERIAYFSSISLNNSICASLTYVIISSQFSENQLYFNGARILSSDRIFQRVQIQLEFIRQHTNWHSHALIISKNLYFDEKGKLSQEIVKEKGLGTSASAGAAIATAIIDILFNHNSKINENSKLRSIFARYLAGSASRSAVGGIGLWISSPISKSWDSFSVRLDTRRDEEFINSIDLINIPLKSSLKTESAHTTAPNSPFFTAWALERKNQILKFIEALHNHNFSLLGQITEEDTLKLHAVTLTSGIMDYIIAWDPETIEIMKFVQNLRNKTGIPVYYSIDTGPSVVILTLSTVSARVIGELQQKFPALPIQVGKIAGSPQIVSSKINPEEYFYSEMKDAGVFKNE